VGSKLRVERIDKVTCRSECDSKIQLSTKNEERKHEEKSATNLP
jgi:hypothetical protein